MNTLLTTVTEEKRARTELEELVSHLEERNKELLLECVKLRDLVNDLLPSSKVWIHMYTPLMYATVRAAGAAIAIHELKHLENS